MKKLIAGIVTALIIFVPILGYSDNISTYVRKDPILAGALSWYVPGLGQMYSGSILKGAVFWAVEETLIVGTVLTFSELKLEVTRGIDLGLSIKSKKNPSQAEKRAAVLLSTSLIVMHFINVIDAVNTALKYNKSFEQTLYPVAEYNAEEKNFSIGLRKNL